jgi:hypothetical protein
MTTIRRRRLVLELCHGCADAQTMRIAAQLAAFLDLDLHGVFIEDTSMLALAELPFVREIRLPTHEWQTIDAGRMQAELHHAATEARRLLNQIAAAIGVPNAFEVLRGEPGETIATVLSAGDIVVLATPTSAGARLAPGFARLHEAAQVSAASVLLLPVGFAPRRGPVVAVLGGADDAGLAPAAQLAISAKEDLLLLLPRDGAAVAADTMQRAVTLGIARSRVTVIRIGGLQAEDILHALGHVRERLIVVTRDGCPAGSEEDASRIAADRGVPVLLVEPDQDAVRRKSSTTAESGAVGSSANS